MGDGNLLHTESLSLANQICNFKYTEGMDPFKLNKILEMSDEVYVQIIKQVSNNPRFESERRGKRERERERERESFDSERISKIERERERERKRERERFESEGEVR